MLHKDSFACSPLAGERTNKERSDAGSRGGAEAYHPSHAQQLCRKATLWEQKLWRHLKQEQLGIKFHRQQPIDRYIVDFVSFEARLIIELDGSQHQQQSDYDQRRDAHLAAQNFTVLRFWNSEIDSDMDGVLARILDALPPHGSPELARSPARGEHAGSV